MVVPFTYGTSEKLTEWTEQFVFVIDTHVVVMVDLKEHVGVAIRAELEVICRGSPERIDDIPMGVCLCISRVDSTSGYF